MKERNKGGGNVSTEETEIEKASPNEHSFRGIMLGEHSSASLEKALDALDKLHMPSFVDTVLGKHLALEDSTLRTALRAQFAYESDAFRRAQETLMIGAPLSTAYSELELTLHGSRKLSDAIDEFTKRESIAEMIGRSAAASLAMAGSGLLGATEMMFRDSFADVVRLAGINSASVTAVMSAGIVHRSWLPEHALNTSLGELIVGRATVGIVETMRELRHAELAASRIAAMEAGPLGDMRRLHERLEMSRNEMSASFASLTSSMESAQRYFEAPEFVLPYSAREVRASEVCRTAVLGRFRKQSDSTVLELPPAEESECIILLKEIDPRLCTPYDGARHALDSKSPDRGRHVLISLRELLSHVLYALAPDQSVLEWIPRSESGMLDNGKPTRRARCRYICRNVSEPKLRLLVDADSRALSELFNVLNEIHKPEVELTEAEMKTLFFRVESYVSYLARINSELN